MGFTSNIDIVIYVIEAIACVSFATSGAFAALRRKADILGVIILTLIAIFGGGLLRDLIINEGAPHIFYDPQYLVLAAIAIVICIFWFVIASIKKTAPFILNHYHDHWIYILDAIGIAFFCISGVRVAKASLVNSAFITSSNVIGQYVYLTCLGVITGVGGGMFRDVFLAEIPAVFKKHFYMTPCIIGTIIYVIMDNFLGEPYILLSISVSSLIIIGLRVAATLRLWNLPSAKALNEIMDQENK